MDEILAKYLDSSPQLTADELLKSKADAYNSLPGSLKVINCTICNNKGMIAVVDNGEIVVRPCSCCVKRSVMRKMAKSGLSDVISRYRFDTFTDTEGWQKSIKTAAQRYANEKSGWFTISGCPGSGKTHICTAICGAMLKSGMEVRYFLWRTEAPALKSWANKPEYIDKVEPYKTVPVLYIDDFWKGKVTDADINLAFDILNARYNNTQLQTIISSELTIEQITEIDEAIGSRIYERSKGNYVRVSGDGKNYRLRP